MNGWFSFFSNGKPVSVDALAVESIAINSDDCFEITMFSGRVWDVDKGEGGPHQFDEFRRDLWKAKVIALRESR